MEIFRRAYQYCIAAIILLAAIRLTYSWEHRPTTCETWRKKADRAMRGKGSGVNNTTKQNSPRIVLGKFDPTTQPDYFLRISYQRNMAFVSP